MRATSTNHRSRLRSVVITANVVVMLGTLVALATAPTGTRLVVIASPWSHPSRVMEIVTQADGALVNGGALDWIVIAEGAGQGFAGRLMAAGAMLVLDGRIAEACLKLGSYL